MVTIHRAVLFLHKYNMKHIIIDTNVVNNDHFLQNTMIKILVESKGQLNHKLYMPMVVVDEMAKHYKEAVDDNVSKATQALSELNKLCGTRLDVDYTDCNKEIGKYKDKLLSILKMRDIDVLPYPKTDHEKLVSKDLAGKKPFKDKGKGYRDALIWESVLDFCKNLEGDR